MKKILLVLLCMILAFTVLVGCAGAVYPSAEAVPMPASAEAPAMQADRATLHFMMPEEEIWFDDFDAAIDEPLLAQSAGGAESGIMPVAEPVADGLAEKIIRTVYAEIESVRFDETIDMIDQLLARHNGFIEHSNISGVSGEARHSGWNTLRSASFTLRIPVGQLDAVRANLDNLGNVVQRENNAENITAMFIDTQSLLNQLRVEEEALLDMLARAEDVPDLILIGEHLRNVRYQIESLTTTLNNWQRQVDYSTLILWIREVEEYTERTQPPYWARIGDGFMTTIRGVGRFFMNLFAWLIIYAPVLVILAGVAVVVWIIVKRKVQAHKKKMAAMPPKPTPQYSHGYAPPAYTPPVNTQEPPDSAPPESTPPES